MAFSRNRQINFQQLIRAHQQQEDGLLSFRAGRLFMNSATKLVTANDKPGKIKLTRSEEGFLNFQWINRITNQGELNIVIFPNTVSWHKVEECKDGRVYLLKFADTTRREFFWMQEPSTDKDNEYFEKINKLCKGQSLDNNDNSNFDPFGQQLSGLQASSGGNLNANSNVALQNLLMAQLSGMNGYNAIGNNANANANASSNINANANTNANANINANANANTNRMNAGPNRTGAPNDITQLLLNAMNNNTTNPTQNTNNNTQNALLQAMQQIANQQREQLANEPDLTDILNPTENGEIVALLDDEKVIEDLSQHLPENMRSSEDIMEHLQSPQFQSSLRRLQGAINGPQMSLILQQMGLPPTQQVGVRAFLRAISQRRNPNDSTNNNPPNTSDSSTKK